MRFRLVTLFFLAAGLSLAPASNASAVDMTGGRAVKKGDNWLAVMDLTATYGMEATLAKALTQVVMTEVSRQGRYDVMSPADIEAVAKREGITQKLSDCENQGLCLIEFGRKLGARYMIAGDVSKIGATYVTTLKFLDTGGDNPGVKAIENEKCKCSDDDLIFTVERLVSKLMAQARGGNVPAVSPPAPETSASAPSPSTASRTDRSVPIASAGPALTDPMTGMEFVSVPAGCFQMGSPASEVGRGDDEGPVHEVCVEGFAMGKFEVTQAQWEAVMGRNPSHFKGSRHPVDNVSWNDIQTFLIRLHEKSGKNFRLPTEAEWEYACRGGVRGGRSCGGDDLEDLAWSDTNSGWTTHPVGQKKANAFGLHDMSGNVWEWCADWYESGYSVSSPRQNPAGPSAGTIRVLRGGSWSSAPAFARAAARGWSLPGDRFAYQGFRLVAPSGQP